MLIPNSVSGPDISLVNTSGQLYGGDTRQILEIFVAQTALPMGCAVSYYTGAAFTAGSYPLKVELTTKQASAADSAAMNAATNLVCGIFAGRVAGASKGTQNTTFTYTGTTTAIPGFHAAAGDVVYVVVKGVAYAYVDGTSDVAIGDVLGTSSDAAIVDDGMLVISQVAAGTGVFQHYWVAATSGGAVTTKLPLSGFATRFVSLQVQAQAGTSHTGANLTSTGACGCLVMVNC